MTGLSCPRLVLATLICFAALRPGAAAAEPLLFSVELDGALPITAPQSDLFGPGASLALGVTYPLLPQILVGGRLRAVGLLDGDPPADPGREDPGIGTLESASLVLRLRPFGGGESLRATGLFLEGAFGAGLTGEESRAALEAGLGYGFDTGDLIVAPVARYLQVVQGGDPISDEDARIAMLGVEFIAGEVRPEPVAPPPPPPPSDRDGDGIDDVNDACPDEPEDHDGHADEDGCPEPDNDEDGILDGDDECPNEPEDVDEFEDADGCPDPDNDQDSFLDEDDECPNEPEIVNGNKDYDGCPDEGLIEFKNDRIVLEERVLFDLERARVKHAGRPTLRAIVKLQEQHPEWIKIRIEGHADVRGDEGYNINLSQRRANNVREALVHLGIPEELIVAQGFGSSRPRDKRMTDEAHARNRRVEFVVVARLGPEPPNGDEVEDDAEPESDAQIDAEGSDAESELEADAESELEADAESELEADADSEPEADAEPEPAGDPEPEGEADSEPEDDGLDEFLLPPKAPDASDSAGDEPAGPEEDSQ